MAFVIVIVVFEISTEASEYQLIDLGTLGGETSTAYGVNDHGKVVGTARTTSENNHPFIWQDGAISELGSMNGAVWSINNAGQVVGISSMGAFIWENDIMTELIMPPEFTEVRAYDINEMRQVVGMRNSGSGHRAYLWENGSAFDLGDLGGDESEARGMNDFGQVVGWSRTVDSGEYNRAFLWENDVMNNLETLGGNESAAFDINNAGKVVGYSRIAIGEQHAFLLEDNVMKDIGFLGGFECIAYSINENDQVVGTSTIPGGERHAFLWQNNIMTDLNDLIPATSNWTLVEAWDINNNGWIVGWGEAPNGSTRAFLLIPEPSTMLLIALGSLMIPKIRKRNQSI